METVRTSKLQLVEPPLSPAATLQAEGESVASFIAARQREVGMQIQIKELAEGLNETSKLLIQRSNELRSLSAHVEDLTFVMACMAYALGAQPRINHALLQQDMASAAEQFWPLGALAPDIAQKMGISAAEATERSVRSTRPATFDLALSQVRIGRKSR